MLALNPFISGPPGLHYGSRGAMIEAGTKRNDLREVVMSKLGREVMPK